MTSRALLALVLLALPALGASRARYGGTLQVALAGKPAEADPLYADTPQEAALVGLVTRAICAAPFVLSRSSPIVLHIEAGAQTKAVAAALERARAEPTPYRALLSSIATVTSTAGGVDLTLAHAWPDLERALCHPALAVATVGPFHLASGPAGHFAADLSFAAGRPYLDEVVVTSSDERGAERLFSQHRAQLVLGVPPKDPVAAALPFATYLLMSNALAPAFRAAFESSVERADLTRFFVRAPAAPLGDVQKRPLKPAALTPSREVTLLFDASLEDQRAVAARIQVRLNPLGYRVALKPLPRRELRARWAAADYELMLSSVLLPVQPANALAVVLELGHASDAAKQLSAVGAITDDAARDDKAKELLQSLLPTINAIPLYVQGLSLQAGPQVQGLKLDAYGLPRLDDVFLGTE